MSKPQAEPEQLYCRAMNEVKLRLTSFEIHLHTPPTMADAISLENACLQLRKILELIAFGSLIANKDAYAAVYENFSTSWNAELLLRDLERVNPKFFPVAIQESPSEKPGVRHHVLEPRGLTKAEFVDVYKKCGRVLHARNPYGGAPSLDFYSKSIPKWCEKIEALLACHWIKLLDESRIWLVHLSEAHDGQARVYTGEAML